MALMRVTSPHAKGAMNTGNVMQLVLLATLPGALCLTWFFGWGTLVNIGIATLSALLFEAPLLYIGLVL